MPQSTSTMHSNKSFHERIFFWGHFSRQNKERYISSKSQSLQRYLKQSSCFRERCRGFDCRPNKRLYTVESHSACKAVSKQWHLLLSNKEQFFTRRKEPGFKDPWLFVFAFHKCTERFSGRFLTLPTSLGTQSRQCLARTRSVPMDLGVFRSPVRVLSLFVVVWYLIWIVPLVLKYEMQKNRWTVMNQMNSARSSFASGVIDGMIYVAGGNSANLFELDSAEVLDP